MSKQTRRSKSERHDTIPGFRPIAPAIWEYIPSLPIDPLSWKPSIDTPSVILLFSWTGAQGRHVAKHTMAYQTLFPTSRIMVITTSAKDLCFRSSARKQARLRPAIERILSYEDHDNILIHAYSEGGSNKAAEFGEAYFNITGTRLPCAAICLDSTPGHPRYLRLCNALAKSLPPYPLVKHIGLLFMSLLLGLIWILYCGIIGFSNNPITQTRSRILDSRYWSPTAQRCYLYSKADEMIAWQDVREHMSQAQALGIPVTDICFEESRHCQHAVKSPDRYWDSVLLTWKRATSNKAMEWKLGVFDFEEVIDFPEKAALREDSWSSSQSEKTLWMDDAESMYYGF